jgi:hypothetical protein
MAMNTYRDCSSFEKAILRRYGKTVTITGKYEASPSGTPIWVSLDITSPKGAKYQLTDHLENGLTKKVVLTHPTGENTFKRYLDAEVAMIDKIAEE